MIPTFEHWRVVFRLVMGLIGLCALVFLGVFLFVLSEFFGDADFPVDCAIVFGATVHRQDAPGPAITRRVQTAVNLYGSGDVKTIFVSGGKGSETQESEAAVMRKVALLGGVDPTDVVIEDQSTSTWENLQFTMPRTGSCSTLVGISDAYHLGRIQYLAYVQGWGRLPVHPASPRPNFSFELRSSFRETLGIIYYIVRDYIPFDIRTDRDFIDS